METSEILHQLLTEAKIPHKVLNAKQNAQEAEIVARAGQVGAVTIATNMAGRGTDIKPTKEALSLGGLYILGTERAEARRIDNQLKGRAGRQGDVGRSKLFLSLEDTLIIRFASHSKLQKLFADSGSDPIEDRFLKKTFIRAQKRIEGFNYDQRKSVLSYDDVIRQQRDLIYEQRDLILKSNDLIYVIEKMISSYVDHVLGRIFHIKDRSFVNQEELTHYFNETLLFPKELRFNKDNFHSSDANDIGERLAERITENYHDLRERQLGSLGQEYIKDLERRTILKALDNKWQDHISDMDRLRQSSHVFQYAQKNPYQVYTEKGGQHFLFMIEAVAKQAIEELFEVLSGQIQSAPAEIFNIIKVGDQQVKIGS